MSNLPVKVNGQVVNYSWTEQEVVGYIQTGKTVNGTVTVFTNTMVKVPEVPDGWKKPTVPGETWIVFEDYDTALGMETIINHVGDCFD